MTRIRQDRGGHGPRRLPEPRNGGYRGPVIVHPARRHGLDLSAVAERERRDLRAKAPPPAAETVVAERLVRLLCIAAIAGVLLAIIARGVPWLAGGAPSAAAAERQEKPQ